MTVGGPVGQRDLAEKVKVKCGGQGQGNGGEGLWKGVVQKGHVRVERV